MELIVTRGDSKSWQITALDDDGSALDLTGCSVTFTAKRTFSDLIENALWRKTIGDGIVATNLASGVVTLQLFPEDTRDIEVFQTYRDKYYSHPIYWDVQLIDNSGQVFTLDRGTIVVEGDVTTPFDANYTLSSGDTASLAEEESVAIS